MLLRRIGNCERDGTYNSLQSSFKSAFLKVVPTTPCGIVKSQVGAVECTRNTGKGALASIWGSLHRFKIVKKVENKILVSMKEQGGGVHWDTSRWLKSVEIGDSV